MQKKPFELGMAWSIKFDPAVADFVVGLKGGDPSPHGHPSSIAKERPLGVDLGRRVG